MAKTYTVKWGDTLWDIAIDNNTSYQTLAKINGLPIVKKNGQDYVYLTVGQVIKLDDDGSTAAKVTTKQVKIRNFGLISGSQTEVYVTWAWDRTNTKEYQVVWEQYIPGRGWSEGSNSTTAYKNSAFNSNNANATKVRVRIKPIAKTYTNSKGKEVAHWTNVSWTSWKTYSFSDNPPLKPSNAPSISIEGKKLTATLEGITALKASLIEFDVAKNGSYSYKKKKISTSKVDNNDKLSIELDIDIGAVYKVRARSIKSDVSTAWSKDSNEASTVPAAPEIKKCMEGSDEASIDIEWSSVPTATSYIIEFCASQEFPSVNDKYPIYTREIKEGTNEFLNCYAKLNGSDVEGLTGSNIFVRIKANNSVGDSEYSNIGQTNIGNGPAAPSVSSNRTIINVGDTVTLQWTHNPANNSTSSNSSTSGSTNTENYAHYSHIDLYVNGSKRLIGTRIHKEGDTDYKQHEKKYTLNTKVEASDGDGESDIVCPEGATISWRARTAGSDGILGEWSAVRTIEVYAQPVLTLRNASDDSLIESEATYDLSKFPININGTVEPTSQYIIGYHVAIVANTTHDVVDNYGETVTIQEGDVVYAKSYDDVTNGGHEFNIYITAADMTLATDVNYTVTCTVTMNSGLSVAQSFNYNVLWASSDYYLDADIEIDEENFTATIHPYCRSVADDTLAEDISLYLYRREYDGTFTRISGNLNNTEGIHVIDPHPALDYARYRIVGVSDDGSTNIYTDLNDYPVGGKAIVIQWDENYSDFTINEDTDEIEGNQWGGQMLKLPYNIDISPKTNKDKSLVEYIGRNYPVSYYGTQLGESDTWNVEIPSTDTKTLYALRRLQKWMGDVYVREPSGTGYWASIDISFNQRHRVLTIPVTINIIRVEGGK